MRIIATAILYLLIQSAAWSQDKVFKRQLILMGTAFEISVVEDRADSLRAQADIQAAIDEIRRIERLISSWDPHSQTSEINRNAGIKPVKVDKELFDLIKRSIAISRLTDGAFDITYASMDKIWRFDGSMKHMPSEEEIKKSVEKVGYQNIVLDEQNHTVFLKKKGMKIGFGGIGKGYAADKAKQLLIRRGVKAGIINASGDLNTWGAAPDGKPWTVAIINPMNKHKAFAYVPISNRAVATSGDYEKYVVFNGIRYAHIINPKTGYPTTGVISVSVFSPSAELSDALATAVFVMGVDVGIDRINQMPGVECIVIDDQGGIHTSKHIELNKL